MTKRTHDKDSELAALAHQNLGMVMSFMGDHVGCKMETGIALKIYQHTLGKDHPDTLAAAAGVGWSLAQTGDLAGACAMLLDVSERQHRVLGKSNNGNGKTLN